jgi:hypothetical protein
MHFISLFGSIGTISAILKKVWLVLAQKKVLEEKFYTTMVDAVLISPLLALPGKDNPGPGC